MCGRTRCSLRADDFPRACHRTTAPTRLLHIDRYRPSNNVSPGFNVPIIRREDGSENEGHVVQCMKWGLIPSFTKKTEKPDHYKMFNARSESIDEKASFRRLLPKNRCLVAVDGFYEWKKDGSKKQPYYIHFKDGRPLVFAALYDSWQNSEGEILYTFTIVTTSSSSAFQSLHDRMPVILGDKVSTDTWLSSTSGFKSVMKPYEESDLSWYPVTPAMGKPSFDGPECIKEIQIKTEGNIPISKFFSRKRAVDEDTKPEHKVCHEPVKIEQTKDLSEEAKTEEERDSNLKSSGSSPSQNVTKFPIKREYDSISFDSKPSLANIDQVSVNAAKKKEKAKAVDDKQPTLFCYFGKR
ncbi:abasic site processing protein YoqW isoform X1 [Trifolium pratense]|uniref:abasic site processing protein YoqW isoform X1 n=1 Tax=Trifolium pratense TaxID=57577 RepID=UPI001E691284|nr:abasic site processing protein YoqW isoform X1 [Trifolium pratense]